MNLTIYDYYDSYNTLETDYYWDLNSETPFYFLKTMSNYFTTSQIHVFLKSLDCWSKYCLTEKRDLFNLYRYRGFNIHFRYFKPVYKHSHGYFYDLKNSYNKTHYFYGCCVVTFSRDSKIDGRICNVFIKEFTVEMHPTFSKKKMKSMADYLMTKYLKNEKC